VDLNTANFSKTVFNIRCHFFYVSLKQLRNKHISIKHLEAEYYQKTLKQY